MALIGVNQIQRRDEEVEVDPLDKLLGRLTAGLQIANTAFNINTNLEKVGQIKQQTELAKVKTEKATGSRGPTPFETAKAGFIAATEDKGIPLQISRGGQQVEERFLSPAQIKQDWATAVALKSTEDKKEEQTQSLLRKDEQDFIKLGDTIFNPSSRRLLGQYQNLIDTADGLYVLLNDGVTAAEQKLGRSIDVTNQKELEIAFDKMSPQKVEEVISAFNRMLTRSAPTVEGMAHLRADTLVGSWKQVMQKIKNAPEGAALGSFVLDFAKTINSERSTNINKKSKNIGNLAKTYGHLAERHPEKFNKIIDDSVEKIYTDVFGAVTAGKFARQLLSERDQQFQPKQPATQGIQQPDVPFDPAAYIQKSKQGF